MLKKNWLFLCGLILLNSSCTFRTKEIEVEKYQPAVHQLPREPRYSRLTWSNVPKPIVPAAETKGPYMRKAYMFDVPNSNLFESVTILATSIGYEAVVGEEIKNRSVSVSKEGTTLEILEEICRQANVSSEVDDKSRTIRVFDRVPVPRFY